MNDQLDTGQDPPPDSAEQLADPDSQNGVTDPAPAQPTPQAQTVQQAAPTGRRSRARAGAGAAPNEPRAPSRPRGKAGDIPDRFDAAATGAPRWSSHDADILWPEMIEWLQRKGRSPYDVTVNVIRVEPPPRASVGEGFEANAAVGDGTSLTPGDAIKRIVEDYYHLPVCRTPAKYELQFVWRADSRYIANGYLSCQSPAEIIALRNAQHARRMHQPQQAMPGLGGYSPPQQQSVPPYVPQFGFPPSQQYHPQYASPPPQPQRDPELERRLSMLEEENRRLRSERDRMPPRPGMGAPVYHAPTAPQQQHPQENMEDRIVQRVVRELRGAGLGAPAPAQVPAAASNDMITTMRQGLAVMREFRRFSEEAGGMFEPDDPPPRGLLPQGTGELPPSPDDDMPYQITDLPSQWGDGSHAKLVRDKETGRVDLLGMALMNPYPSQKFMDAGAAFMQRFGRGLGRPQEDEMEEVPEVRQQQPQPPPQQQLSPSPEEPPQTGGSPEPGWDNLT